MGNLLRETVCWSLYSVIKGHLDLALHLRVESKPANGVRIKTGQSEACCSYQFFRFMQAV
jgi:hypothetical protein